MFRVCSFFPFDFQMLSMLFRFSLIFFKQAASRPLIHISFRDPAKALTSSGKPRGLHRHGDAVAWERGFMTASLTSDPSPIAGSLSWMIRSMVLAEGLSFSLQPFLLGHPA